MKCLCKSSFPFKLSLILLGALCFLLHVLGSPMMSPAYADDKVNDGAAIVVSTTADRGPGSPARPAPCPFRGYHHLLSDWNHPAGILSRYLQQESNDHRARPRPAPD